MIQSDPNRHIAVVHTTEQQDQEHLFGFICTPETSLGILRELGKIAANPELPFDWVDAAMVAEEIRRKVYDMQHPPTASIEGPKDMPPGMRRR